MKRVISVILGGGKGTRLYPLTHVRSKPAVPLGGKYRLIDIPVSNCINSGVSKIFVITQYNSESLNRHINQTYRFDVFSEGFVDILAAEQTPETVEWFQGTADAVRRTMRHILNYRAKEILILSGDQLYRMDYSKLIRYHRKKKADLTVGVIPVEKRRVPAFGILKMANDGALKEFHEKPKDEEFIDTLKVDVEAWREMGVTESKPYMASMGIYVFNVDALVELLKDESHVDFGGHVIPRAIKSHSVAGFPFSGYWEDIGTIEAFYKANLDLASAEPKFTFFDAEFPIFTHARFLPANRIRNCEFEETVVAEGCSIFNSKISNSIIGIRSVLRNATLVDTLMMGADYYDPDPRREPIRLGVARGTFIKGAIVDKNARIGENVRIENVDGHQEHDGNCGTPMSNYHIRDGIVIIPKNSVIPDGSVI
ncbi:MAG TPA: glucose-1-phosphate adenylyltransferase [Acidobacteriota bacterium]|nr:glucose-1-phosphate adenylyltransferase [Acidobacteriota bacterium]